MSVARAAVGWIGLAVYGVGALIALFFPIQGASGRLVDLALDTLARATAPFDLGIVEVEMLANVLVFIPIGVFTAMVLPRRLWWIAVLAGATLSTAAELFQNFVLASRVGSVRDVFLNIAGTALGAILVRIVRREADRPDYRYS